MAQCPHPVCCRSVWFEAAQLGFDLAEERVDDAVEEGFLVGDVVVESDIASTPTSPARLRMVSAPSPCSSASVMAA